MNRQKTPMEQEDVEFNEYLTMFSLPASASRSTPRATRAPKATCVSVKEEIPLLRKVSMDVVCAESEEMEELISEDEDKIGRAHV